MGFKMITCAVVEKELRTEMSKLDKAALVLFALGMGVDNEAVVGASRSEIVEAAVAVELHAFVH